MASISVSRQPTSAARRLRPAPAKLGEILRLVALIPGETVLPDLSELKGALSETIHKRLAIHLDAMPPAFQRHVWLERALLPTVVVRQAFIGVAPEKSKARMMAALKKHASHLVRDAEGSDFYGNAVRRAWFEYEFIRRSRENLRRVAETAQEIRAGAPAHDICWIEGGYSLNVMGDGSVYTAKDRLIEALDVDGMDVTRIRLCEICTGVYWAGRDDQKTCSPDCHRKKRNRDLAEKRSQGYYQGYGNPTTTRKARKR